MAILKLFSMRQKEARGEMPDVFMYDSLPAPLRAQVIHIMDDVLGRDVDHYKHYACMTIVRDVLRREHGLIQLIEVPKNPRHEVQTYFLQLQECSQAIDVVELVFTTIDGIANKDRYRDMCHSKVTLIEAIDDLNQRFKQHGVGYQFESNEIIKVDNQIVHSEIIKPVLQLLRASEYKGANEEFLKAFEHYKHDRYQECLVDALKAFESVIKSICKAKGWTYQTSDSIKKLIEIVFEHELLPAFMQSEFSALRGLLEGGTSVVRNKLGGHGQGTDQVSVPAYWARYALNTAASNILLLVEAAEAK